MAPQRLKLRVKETSWLNHRVLQVVFELLEPKEISFIPGQHISVIIGDVTRPYCLSSDCRVGGEIAISVSAAHEGLGSNFLRSLKVGDEIEALGPLGRLKLAQVHKPNIVFIGTGTGVSPMVSMLTELNHQKVQSNITLFFGLRNKEDMFFEKELENLKTLLPNFDYKFVYSEPKEGWDGLRGYVTDVVDGVIDAQNTQYYVIGHKGMVFDVIHKLVTGGVAEENIIR